MKHKILSFILLLTLTLSSAACNLVVTPPPQLTPNGVIFTAEQTTANLDVFGSSINVSMPISAAPSTTWTGATSLSW